MSATTQLLERDPALKIGLHKKHYWFHVTDFPGIEFPEGMETSVGELLYGLIKVIQPKRIIETGTRCGISTRYMQMAADPACIIQTIERDTRVYDYTWRKFSALGIDNIQSWNAESLSCLSAGHTMHVGAPLVDFALLDSEPCYRYRELEMLIVQGMLSRGAVIAIHDLPNIDCAPFEPNLEWIHMVLDNEILMPFCFPNTDSGLTLFQYRGHLWNR